MSTSSSDTAFAAFLASRPHVEDPTLSVMAYFLHTHSFLVNDAVSRLATETAVRSHFAANPGGSASAVPLAVLQDWERQLSTVQALHGSAGVLGDFLQGQGAPDSIYSRGCGAKTLAALHRVAAPSEAICTVCQEQCKDEPAGDEAAGDSTRSCVELGCKHVFHFKCLEPWLKKQATCPTCREEVPLVPGDQRPTEGASHGNEHPMVCHTCQTWVPSRAASWVHTQQTGHQGFYQVGP